MTTEQESPAVDSFAIPMTTDLRMRWFRRKPKHRHDYRRVGYGGAGWSLYRCACGATEINA